MACKSKIMFRKKSIAGLAFLIAAPAFAHHPTIEADAVCNENGNLVINYVSTSWLTTGEAGSGNSQVDILFNGVKVDEGAYVAPTFSFSGSKPAPAGTSATVTAVAVGDWDSTAAGGQSESVNVTYSTDVCAPPSAGAGRFTGGGLQINGGTRITRGFTIHCDLLLSNNFEVNWGGNKFHMNEHLETLACSDDPSIGQAPPAAPLDTLVGVGTGRYNGVDGYTIELTLVDHGEPGSSDQAALRIYETTVPSNVVLNVPLQVLRGGNLQAHYDQPHK